MVLYPPRAAGTDSFVRIYNNDGSEAGACGNGMRCVAAIVTKETGKADATFQTSSGHLELLEGRERPACSPSTWASRVSAGRKFR